MPTPSLYRVAVGVLALAAAANVLLWSITAPDDWFANIVAIASAVVVVALLTSAFVPALARLREEALLLALMVWVANLIEFATQDDVRWESRLRLCGFYAAFAGLALGTYLAQRLTREETT